MAVKGFLRMAPADQLEELMDELSRGRIYECSLRSESWQHDGLLSGEQIYIDPRPQVLEAVLHELLHRRKPRLTERSVTKAARDLVTAMDEGTKQRWWKAYKRIVKKGVPVDVED